MQNGEAGQTRQAVPVQPVKMKKPGKMVRKKPYVTAIVILAVLMAAGVGFGVTGMILNSQKAAEIADLEKKIAAEKGESGAEEMPGTSEASGAGDLLVRWNKFVDSDPEQPVNFGMQSEFANGALRVLLTEKAAGTVVDCSTGEEQDEDEYKLTMTVDYDALKEPYGLDGTKSGTEEFEITGVDAADVVDVLIVGFGNGIGSETVLMQMKDGTVEYIPVKKALQEGNGMHSFGKIEGVEDVVRLRTVMASGDCSAGNAGIAQKANGEIYDLYAKLAYQGAWD